MTPNTLPKSSRHGLGIGGEAGWGVRCGEGGALFTVGKILNFASKRPPNQPVFRPSDECPMTFAQHCKYVMQCVIYATCD